MYIYMDKNWGSNGQKTHVLIDVDYENSTFWGTVSKMS